MAPRAEIRWFVPGGADGCRRPPGRPVVRTDLYQRSTLSPTRSIKLRGRTTLEHKVRTGSVTLVRLGALQGFAETWLKTDVQQADPRHGHEWVKVRKELWRSRGVEVGRLEIAGQRWWTVCLSAPLAARPPELLEQWRDVLVASGQAHSYASWILQVERSRSGRRRR